MDPLNESARSALAQSCYLNINWKIHKDAMVIEAINHMVAANVGALAVANDDGEVVGIVSERDYLCKVGILGRTSKNTKGYIIPYSIPICIPTNFFFCSKRNRNFW